MALALADAIQYAYNAGFRGEQIVTIVSISLCECGSQACQCNYDCCPPSQSCGVLQVFQAAHPGTAACAVDPACAYRLGWTISSHGQSFHPWTTFNNGCYQQHTGAVRGAMNAMPAPIGSGGPPTPPPVTCTGGSSWGGSGCVCPPGMSWGGASCVHAGGGMASGTTLAGLALLAGAGALAYHAHRGGGIRLSSLRRERPRLGQGSGFTL